LAPSVITPDAFARPRHHVLRQGLVALAVGLPGAPQRRVLIEKAVVTAPWLGRWASWVVMGGDTARADG